MDADFVGKMDSRRSIIGYVFTLGTMAINLISQLQKIVALSKTEAKYVT